MTVSFAPSKAPLTAVRAWTYLGINLFATPGLGSVMGGRKVAGTGQLILAVAGFFLIVIWMLRVIFGSINSELSGASEPAGVPAWWWQFGTLFFGTAWLWSLVTSISLVIQAGKTVVRVPPKLAGVSKPIPPKL